mgnify:CR=1 FL=1
MTELISGYAAEGVLTSADLAITNRLATLMGEPDPLAQLALAFAVRAIRTGSTCFDPTQDPDVPGLTWPDPATILAAPGVGEGTVQRPTGANRKISL